MNGEKDTVIQNIGKNKGISLRLRITLLVSLLLLVLNGVLSIAADSILPKRLWR